MQDIFSHFIHSNKLENLIKVFQFEGGFLRIFVLHQIKEQSTQVIITLAYIVSS